MSNKLYVTNVPITVDDGDLRQLFASYGTVHSLQVFVRSGSQLSSKAGLVEMDSDQEGDAAITGLDGRQYDDRLLTVTWASTRNETDAAHSSLFGPMNMTADDPPHERRGVRPVDSGNDRHGGIPYIVGDAAVSAHSAPGDWGPFVPAASERAIRGMISEGTPVGQESQL